MTLTQHTHPALHPSHGVDGTPRRVGIEVEFAHLDDRAAAYIIADVVGGTVRHEGAGWVCETEVFGTCEVYLDTKYKDNIETLGTTAVDLARQVIPVELVTAPFDPKHLATFDKVLAGLRDGGAKGSRASPVYGFGVHLNVEIAAPATEHIGRVAQSFALLEPAIRAAIDLDPTRRLLPFVDRYPNDLVTALAQPRPLDAAALVARILLRSGSRNHGLDLLPCLAWLAPDEVAAHTDEGVKNSPRPAYHYRLPESRVDEPGWGIGQDWRIWLAVERVAGDDALLRDLSDAWHRQRATGVVAPRVWVPRVHDILKQHNQQEDLI